MSDQDGLEEVVRVLATEGTKTVTAQLVTDPDEIEGIARALRLGQPQ